MIICLVSQEYPPETARGGIGSQTWNKARMLARLGHTVHVVAAGIHDSVEFTREDREGTTVHRIPPPATGVAVHVSAPYWIGYSTEVLRYLRRLNREARFDLIDFAEYGAEGFLYQLDRNPEDWVAIAVQLHGPLAMFAERIGWPDPDSDFYRVGTFMESYSIRNADALMACSANIADFTAEHCGLPRESIAVVHCGVDTEQFQPDPHARQRGRRPTVLFVGNLAVNKGMDVVFDAVMRLRARYPDILLVALGKGESELMLQLERQVREAGAASNFAFPGFADREELPGYYRGADVFCSPAEHEVGVANVYIEAMASGCPVVACNTGAAPEAIEHGRHGFLVNPHDVDATAAALDRILGNPELRATLGAAGRRRAEEYFAMEKYIQRVLASYQRAIAESNRKLHS